MYYMYIYSLLEISPKNAVIEQLFNDTNSLLRNKPTSLGQKLWSAELVTQGKRQAILVGSSNWYGISLQISPSDWLNYEQELDL